MEVIDGKIEPDSGRGKAFGFTSDKFDGWLWKTGKYIYVSFIISRQPNKGNFSDLMDRILENGFGIKVPTPSPRMVRILKDKGFRETSERGNGMMGNFSIEVWVKDAK